MSSIIVAKNSKASFNYIIEDKLEAGIVLTGSEVKAIRLGKIALADSHATVHDGEIYLYNCHIDKYEQAGRFNHETRRPRKLLLHGREIKKIIGKIKIKGYTLIAKTMYFNKRNILKVELAIARGKKQHDKRETIKERDWQREQGRLMRKKHG